MSIKNKLGIIPLFILIAVGIIIVGAGGAYVVHQQFIKTGKSGKAALNVDQVREQIAKPTSLPSPSPQSPQKTVTGPVTYIPPSPSPGSQIPEAPRFTITPPSGWLESSPVGATVLAFEAPEKDMEEGEKGSGLIAWVRATISIQLQDFKQKVSLDTLIAALKENAKESYESAQFLSETPTTLSGHDVLILESKLFKKGNWTHSIDYVMVEGNWGVVLSGASLDSTWSNWASTMKGSIETFSFKN